MNGYLTFLQNLSEYQQKAEIAHRAFSSRWLLSGPGLEEELLQAPAVAAFSRTLGVDPSCWKLELQHYAEEPDVIDTPVFDADQCRAPFTLRYVEDLRYIDHLNDNLVVTGMIYIDDNQSALIGTLAASSTREKSCARERLIALGINPDTLGTVGYEDKIGSMVCGISSARALKLAAKMPYLDCLDSLLPQQRREAIYHLSDVAWKANPGARDGNPLFMGHPKLAPELARLEIRDLGISDFCHMVGPVEFAGGQCTAPIWYPLYGGGSIRFPLLDEDGKPLFDADGNLLYERGGTDSYGYYVEVHLLAGIGNKPGGGGDIWIKDLWFRLENIDEPESDTVRPLLVP